METDRTELVGQNADKTTPTKRKIKALEISSFGLIYRSQGLTLLIVIFGIIVAVFVWLLFFWR